ncbi:MAG: ribosome small subunit-dependent GTPase A [Clostridia bacterium]|nr:ribosome small subunit-dependent GTPase A [Clostridia bacterium]
MNIETYGFYPSMILEHTNGTPARVTAVHRDRYEIVCDSGVGFARLKAGAYHSGEEPFPTVGDFVLIDWQQSGDSRILKTLPRKTYFSRLDPSSSGHGEQAVAANFDYVFILQSLDRNFNLRRLERYLTLAWQSGAVPAVILTKADCAEDLATRLRAAEKLAVGAGVFAVSAKTGQGLDQLAEYLIPGKTIVFLGSSGVGKSSLANALAGDESMVTSGIREKDGRGRHTTTHRQLLLLSSGVMIIDTPGMRELGMWDAGEGLEQSFSDVQQFLGHCKFSDCRHQGEPGCAITKAIRSGELAPERWEGYLMLNKESQFTDDKAGYLREKKQLEKDFAKARRQQQTVDYRHEACTESFPCKVCGTMITPEDAGSQHRNHCPRCLASVHVDNHPGDRASLCKGVMDPISVWVRKNGEWAIIHRCRSCGALSSNRIAADDNPMLLMSIALKPLASPPFPLWQLTGQPPTP